MIIEGSYASLLSGVSQQVPRERMQGQLSVQENMLSDPVTGIRRRPGLQFRSSIPDFVTEPTTIKSMYMEVGGKAFNLYLNIKTGKYTVTNRDHAVTSSGVCDYIKAANVSSIRVADAGGDGWILNTEKTVGLAGIGAGKRNPKFDGFFYIRTGAFQKVYSITIKFGDWTKTFEYKTGDTAAQSVPEGVAEQLVALMNADTGFTAKFHVNRIGAYVYITRDTKDQADVDTTISSPSGQNYVMTSGAMNMALVQDLPAQAPWDGLVVSIGKSLKAREYYHYDLAKGAWEECASYRSATAFTNTPIRFALTDAGVFSWDAIAFEGRVSGDDENNPYPEFVNTHITGLSSYQGRLVLLTGAYVCMSASNYPTRFTRSTVTTIRDDDPIQTGAGSATAAAFEYGIQFSKDLVLISRTHQAVVPTGQAGITPLNAMVVLTSKQDVDTTAEPQVIGRTLMFSTPISEHFFGVSELIPSQYTNSQYTPQTLTDHIPRYMPGRCRQIVGSNSANIALFTSNQDFHAIIVHEYLWQGEERALVAWHHWTMPTSVVAVHFSRDIIVVNLQVGTSLVICTIDPKASAYLASGATRPFLDCFQHIQCIDRKFTVPMHLRDAYKKGAITLTNTVLGLEGEPIGIENIDTNTWIGTTVPSFTSGTVGIGWKYTSAMSPTPPMLRDQNDVVIGSAKTTLMRYSMSVQKTGEFTVHVRDTDRVIAEDTHSALTWSSSELGLGRAQLATIGYVVVPCRTLASTTETTLSTSGTRELNVLDIEYVLRTAVHPERKRI